MQVVRVILRKSLPHLRALLALPRWSLSCHRPWFLVASRLPAQRSQSFWVVPFLVSYSLGWILLGEVLSILSDLSRTPEPF